MEDLTFCIDIDGTLCTITTDQQYHKAVPKMDIIKAVNYLYDTGHHIKIFTARGMSSGKDFKEITQTQLKKWRVKYHELIMNKPSADIYVDDKCCGPREFATDVFRKKWLK